MPNNKNNDEFPTIRLDDEDRRDYQNKRYTAPSGADSSASSLTSSRNNTSPSTGASGLWVTFVALIALAACGGCYYLFTLLQQQQLAAQEAEKRIVQLENTLSATGEEMGESTIALQVKVTELNNRTNELWEQMDKLWASAWRRNQKEIADLGDRVGNIQTSLKAELSVVAKRVNTQDKSVESLTNELASLADELLAVNVQLEQALDDKQRAQTDVKNLTDKLSVLEQRNATLSGRISNIESEIRDMATKLVTKSSNAGATQPKTSPPAGG